MAGVDHLVITDAGGLTAERQDTFNHEPQFAVTFDGVLVGGAYALVGVGLAVITGDGRYDALGAMALDRCIDFAADLRQRCPPGHCGPPRSPHPAAASTRRLAPSRLPLPSRPRRSADDAGSRRARRRE